MEGITEATQLCVVMKLIVVVLCQARRPCQVIVLNDGLQFYQTGISDTAQHQDNPTVMYNQERQVC